MRSQCSDVSEPLTSSFWVLSHNITRFVLVVLEVWSQTYQWIKMIFLYILWLSGSILCRKLVFSFLLTTSTSFYLLCLPPTAPFISVPSWPCFSPTHLLLCPACSPRPVPKSGGTGRLHGAGPQQRWSAEELGPGACCWQCKHYNCVCVFWSSCYPIMCGYMACFFFNY